MTAFLTGLIGICVFLIFLYLLGLIRVYFNKEYKWKQFFPIVGEGLSLLGIISFIVLFLFVIWGLGNVIIGFAQIL